MSRPVNPMLGAEPSVQLFRVVLTLATHLRTRMDQRLAEVGLTTAQAGVLTFGTGSDHAPTLGDAARSLGTSHQNVRQVVAALERKGMIEVLPDPLDARVRRLAITPRVGEVFADRDPADQHEVALWLSTLTQDEQHQAVGLLHRVLKSLVDEPAARSRTPSRRSRAEGMEGPRPEGI
jgi:DNA-binding MarR family transcriptional regulator